MSSTQRTICPITCVSVEILHIKYITLTMTYQKQKNQVSFLVGKNRLGGEGDVKMITLLHRRGWGWYFVGGYAQMIVILHWGEGGLSRDPQK